jgi:hypothetical protein
MSSHVALTVTVNLAILPTPISISTGAQTARNSTVGPRDSFATHLFEEAVPGRDPGAEDLSAMLRGLARYQGHGRRVGCAPTVCSVSRLGA